MATRSLCASEWQRAAFACQLSSHSPHATPPGAPKLSSPQRCELFTCDMEAVKRRIPDMTTSTLLLPPVMGVLEEPPTDGETGQGASDRDSGPRAGDGGGGAEVAMADAAAAAASRKGSGMSDDFSAGAKVGGSGD